MNRHFVIVVGMAALLLVAAIPYLQFSGGDVETAQAVAKLLSRAAISDADLNAAMKISGVRDAYVAGTDGVVVLPARRGGSVEEDQTGGDGSAVARMPVGENHVVVVSAREQAPQPQSPIIMFTLIASAGVLFILRGRKNLRVMHAAANPASHLDEVSDVVSLDLASRAAGAALIRLDQGCRVVTASRQAQEEFGVAATGSHLIDALAPQEVQPVLQLIRRSDRSDIVSDDVHWKGDPVHACVMKDGEGFLVKLSRRCCDE